LGEAFAIAEDDVSAEEKDADEREFFQEAMALSLESGETGAHPHAKADGKGEKEKEAYEEHGGGHLEFKGFLEEKAVGPDPHGHGDEGQERCGDGEGDGEGGIGAGDVGVEVGEVTSGTDGDEEDTGFEMGGKSREPDESDGHRHEEEESEKPDEDGFGVFKETFEFEESDVEPNDDHRGENDGPDGDADYLVLSHGGLIAVEARGGQGVKRCHGE
jgi:hypothetical protein